MRENWVGWSVVGLLIVSCGLLIDPALLGLSMYEPIAHLVAIRGWLALGGLLLAGALGLCALLVRHRGEHHPTRLLAACVVLVLFAATNVGFLLARGVAAPEALPDAKQAEDIDVLAFNTYDTIDGPAAIADLIAQHEPDIVMLSETYKNAAEQIAGDNFVVFMGIGRSYGSAPTALLIAESMGEYLRIVSPDSEYGMVGAAPADGEGPVLYAVHVVSPVGDQMPLWRAELDLVMGICKETDNVIMAGDFNATVDHAPLRDTSCINGSLGSGGVGTWPTALPELLGAPIDHVFADPAFWRPVASAVVALPQADHRGVLVRLSPS